MKYCLDIIKKKKHYVAESFMIMEVKVKHDAKISTQKKRKKEVQKLFHERQCLFSLLITVIKWASLSVTQSISIAFNFFQVTFVMKIPSEVKTTILPLHQFPAQPARNRISLTSVYVYFLIRSCCEGGYSRY